MKKKDIGEDLSPPPRGGAYSVGLIQLALHLVLEAGISMRGVAAVLALVGRHFQLSGPMPCASTIRCWIQRVGCYSLQQPLACQTDWVWLIDHTMQIGSLKLFVIVGCPLERVSFGQRSLALTDLNLIALVPMESSSQEQVAAVLEEAVGRTGVPRQIVSDDAADLQKGVERFQQRHPETIRVHDVAHHAANVLKHYWDGDARWHALVSRMQQTSEKLRQSKQAYLLAPRLRRKARFMSVESFVRYAAWLLRELQKETPRPDVQNAYAWLREFAEEIPHWREQLRLSQALVRRVRLHGLHCWTLTELEADWGVILPHPKTQLLVMRLKGYVQKHCRRVRGSETLVGSTEILESAFGKQKRLVGDQSESGLTGMTLALGAIMSGGGGEDFIRDALETVPEKEAAGWIGRTIGKTVQWFRRKLLKDMAGAPAPAASAQPVPIPG